MIEWKKQEDGSEVMESKLWRLRVFDLFDNQAFAVDVKCEGGGWLELYMSTSSSPRKVAKEAALVALSWFRDSASGLLPAPLAAHS